MHFKQVMTILGLAILASGLCWVGSASAEGSRTLYPATYPGGNVCNSTTNPTIGCRSNLDLQANFPATGITAARGTGYLGRVIRRTFLYVYAEENEYILLGSRNRDNGGDIFVYNPQNFGVPGQETVPGSASFTCSVGGTPPDAYGGAGRGIIASRAQELAGPNSADNTVTVTNGFSPCAYRAPTAGIYGVIFSAATSGGSGPDGIIDTPNIGNNTVSAWDVTVRGTATSTTDLNGRLFTYAWAGFTGNNNRPDYSTHYYIGHDGYRYWQELHGLDPNGYVLYANRYGFLDNGVPLYKDLRAQAQPGVSGIADSNYAAVSQQMLAPGLTTQIAEYPHFFSDVSPSGSNATEVNKVLTALGYPTTPLTPTLSNVSFKGWKPNNNTTVGAGGTFTFTVTNTDSYLIVISRDGTDFSKDTLNNAVLTGIATDGTYTVNWDGKDQNNVNFPASLTTYPFKVYGRTGEMHFPIIDAENNGDGLTKNAATFGGGPDVTVLNGINAGSDIVYFDDRGYLTSSGSLIGNLNSYLCGSSGPQGPNPLYNLNGINSAPDYTTHALYRWWLPGSGGNEDCGTGVGFGDAKALNLWTYTQTPGLNGELQIDPVIYDGATTVTAPAVADAGSTVQGAFTFSNNGNATVTGVTYSFTASSCSPALTFQNLPTGATVSSCSGGTYTFSGFSPSLLAGEQVVGGTNPSAPMTFSYTAPSSGSLTVNTAITISEEDNYPANNNDTATTFFGAVDVATTVSVPASALAGSTVEGSFTFANLGNNNASGVTYTAVFTGTLPTAVNFPNLPSGVTASYNNVTGEVSFTGLPTTMAAGQSFNFGFTYTMPATGPVTLTTTTGATGDANPNNNTDNGSTVTRQLLSIGGSLFRDNGTGTGGVLQDGIQNGTEPNVNLDTSKYAPQSVVILDDQMKVVAIADICWKPGLLCPSGQVLGDWASETVPEGTNYKAYIVPTASVPNIGDSVPTPVPAASAGWSLTRPNVDGSPQGSLGNGLLDFTPAAGMKLNFGVLKGSCSTPPT